MLKFYLLGYQEPHIIASRYYKCTVCIPLPFNDVNLVKIEDDRKDLSHVRWSGFIIDKKQDFVVTHASNQWSTPLPPIGAKLHTCDNRQAQKIYQNDILPYLDQRATVDSKFATSFFSIYAQGHQPIFNQKQYQQCRFKLHNGEIKTYNLQWQSVAEAKELTNDDWKKLVAKFAKQRSNKLNLNKRNNMLWAKIPSFTIKSKQVKSYNKLLKLLQNYDEPESLVIDLRGNTGSSVFYMGQLAQSLFPNMTSFYVADSGVKQATIKVSQKVINYFTRVKNSLSNAEQLASTPKYQFELATANKLLALAEKHQDHQQPLVVTANELPEFFHYKHQENTRKNNFASKVYLLTDSRCFSACLSFVDLMKTQQNVVHVGQTTNADTSFLMTAYISEKDKKSVRVPFMRYHNRARKDNQPITPDYAYEDNILDSKRVLEWLSALDEKGS